MGGWAFKGQIRDIWSGRESHTDLNEEILTGRSKWSPWQPRGVEPPGGTDWKGSPRRDLLREGNTSLLVVIVSPGHNMKSGSINTVARLS